MHRLNVRVYFEDTDLSGNTYHGSYVRFLERGRTELVRSLNVSQANLFEQDRFAFVVTRMTVEFLRSARMDDELTVLTEVKEMRGASIHMAQAVLRGEERLVTADVVVAGTKEGKAVRIPEEIRRAFSRH